MMNENHYKRLTEAYGVILDVLRANTSNPEALQNFVGSEDRCARALLEVNWSEQRIKDELAHIVGKSFPVSENENQRMGIVCQGPIRINSCCPHHLYPVAYDAYVAYIPTNGVALGLSKLARIAKILGHRPVLHEQLAADIASVLCRPDGGNFVYPSIVSGGSAVLLVGVHGCMFARGIEQDAKTAVCELRGSFELPGMEQKFYALVKSIRDAKILN